MQITETEVTGYSWCQDGDCIAGLRQKAGVRLIRIDTRRLYNELDPGAMNGHMVESSWVDYRFADPADAVCEVCAKASLGCDVQKKPVYPAISGQAASTLLTQKFAAVAESEATIDRLIAARTGQAPNSSPVDAPKPETPAGVSSTATSEAPNGHEATSVLESAPGPETAGRGRSWSKSEAPSGDAA